MSFFSSSSSNALVNNAAADKDIEVADPPTDSISSVSFSPTADYLAVGSWDNNVRERRLVTRRMENTIDNAPIVVRFAYTKSGRAGRRRARRCTRTKGPC